MSKQLRTLLDGGCIVVPMNEKFILFSEDKSTRFGIFDTWEEADAQKKLRTMGSRDLYLRGALGKTRRETIDGKEYLVVPVVALQEGVIHAVNAPNPEFVSVEVLKQSVDQWEGAPLVVNHPSKGSKKISVTELGVLEDVGFGIVRLPKMEGKRLTMEALVDPKRLEDLGETTMLEDLEKGKIIEVSIGAFVRTNSKESSYKGKKYKGEWLEIVRDHLAFLPNGRGACSVEMGCGANRAAMHFVTAEDFELEYPTEEKPKPSMPAFMIFSALGEKSLDERIMAVQDAVYKKFGTESGDSPIPAEYAYAKQIFDDRVIVCKGATHWSVPYILNSSGEIIFGDPTKVIQTYVAAEEDMRANAGARNSRSDLERIQSMHDNATALGAVCDRKNYDM